MLQNLKILGDSVDQTTGMFENFDNYYLREHGEIDSYLVKNVKFNEDKNDEFNENPETAVDAVQIQFTKKSGPTKTYKKTKKGKNVRVVLSCGKVKYAKYGCDSCEGFGTNTLDNVLRHQFEKHGQTLCSQCGASFDHYKDLKTHMFSHEDPVKCDFCDRQFNNPRARKNHMSREHGSINVDEKRIICPECGDIVLERNLEIHRKRNHSKDHSQKIPCPHCEYTAWQKQDINSHIKKVHDIKFKPKPCPFCNRLVKHLADHIRRTQCDVPESERTLKKYKCETCNKTFNNKGGYDRHVRDFHGEGKRDIKCDLCNYATYNKFNLFIHVRRMHEGKPLKKSCPYCSKETIKLEHHIRLYHPEYAEQPTMLDV